MLFISRKNKLLSILALLMAAVLCAPYAAFGAGPMLRSSGMPAVSGPRPAPTPAHDFRHPGFFVGDRFGGGAVVTVEQSQAAPVAAAEKPDNNRVYIPPHWVDGGSGVQLSVPGYWTDAAPRR
jgi:hypothetical protein